MPKISSDSQGRLILPNDFLQRRHMPPSTEYWLNERQGDIILHPRVPDVQKLYLEATTGCNLQCRTCIRNIWGDPSALMKWDTFEALMNSLDGLPELKRVVFTGFGEPLSHPRILEMIERVRQRGLAVSIGSNGLLLREKMARELVRLGVDRLVVSVDGVKPETYGDVRGAGLSELLDNVRRLNDIKQEVNTLIPALGIEFVVLKSNIDELPALTQLASHLNASRVLVTNVLPYTADMRDQMLYGYDPQPSLDARNWPVHSGAWVTWGSLDLPRMHWGAERRCKFIQDRSMVIGWDGGVTPCYALSHNYSYYAIDGCAKQVERYVLGNVNQQTLADIWMSEDYVLFRSEVRSFHFPSCPNCDLRETCDLRQRNEGCWGWNPSCADCLWAQDIVRCP
ncbi:MAG TPA: tungsten cofactor oxidoreductase radical SAM maturase [Anaerolineaceae bacterium]|jgi:tungsten cofactor oxidoreducase radical SAM maturase|nr:tungsten cofactor oxidoreductase radical SAM maturase [Anaerolineaceae bacterium]HOD44410.1 tungsten cofactor oxidoreductase radical SAM maturase [Anaerolineaceae bacterium]HOH20358.1 tungsten cofactor oxidoreductase radical SAM maturase [Anaerolineaceae bacterium]